MTDLHLSDQLIVNELFDHSVFSSAVSPQSTKLKVEAAQSLKLPRTQRRISTYLKDLIGTSPESFQGNLVLLVGKQNLTAEQVHILLATLKAVINLPELQNSQNGSVVATETLVRQVRSEIPDLDEKEIQRSITQLFVDRLSLFKEDSPEQSANESAQAIAEYWDIDPNFNAVAQSLVNRLQQATIAKLTPIQEVNRELLVNSFLSRNQTPGLWPTLQANKAEIAAKWRQTGRYELECGDDYALLLDNQRSIVTAKPFVLAIAVAQSLGVGIQEDQLTAQIKMIAKQQFPHANIGISLVKNELFNNQLVRRKQNFIVPTALVARFQVQQTEEVAK